MGAIATKKITAGEYYEITVLGDRKQLVEGQIVVNEAKPIHGLLQMRLGTALFSWTQAADGRGLALTPTDVRLDEHNVYGPDLLWFAAEHVPEDLYVYPERVPDLCVEIRSPGTWRFDVGAKQHVYERSGLPELWLVDDASDTVLALRRSAPGAEVFDVALELGRGEELTSPQLPGFSLSLDELFAR